MYKGEIMQAIDEIGYQAQIANLELKALAADTRALLSDMRANHLEKYRHMIELPKETWARRAKRKHSK
jgi:CYTH domain-containing protein